jgi:exodeoxyribonuclease V gamma subunit
MGLKIFTSNRLETLAENLSEVLKVPLSSPLDKEVIIVQSRGMERWVSMRLAHHLGISANISFAFPKAFVSRITSTVMPEFQQNQAADPDTMTWKILGLIPSFIKSPGFETIDVYLSGSNAADEERGLPYNLKLFQLAERIAHVFDQYLIFRHEMVMSWEADKIGGKDEKWQAEIWRALMKGESSYHPARLRDEFLKKMQRESIDANLLPERISIFGISSLPRFHLDIIHALAGSLEVNFFLMSPSQEFWLDIRSDREMSRELSKVREKTGGRSPTEESLYLERGNSLLSSLGSLARDFFGSMSDFQAEYYDSFDDGGERNILSAVQSDMLNLRDRGRTDDDPPLDICDDDLSIQIHSCHSKMREVEVLYDNVLAMFEEDPSLLPKDILVMTPDIESYAPVIQAVFDIPESRETSQRQRIPFSIADISVRTEVEITETFFEILDLFGSRFEVSRIISILESTHVGRKFDLSEKDVATIRWWVGDTRIYWGIDEEDRRHAGLPGIMENTWKAGLERLLLGYAMPRKDDRLFEDVLPYDDIEGGDAAVLGRFLTLVNELFEEAGNLGRLMTIDAWSRTLVGIMEKFFQIDDDMESGRGLHVFRQKLMGLEGVRVNSGFSEALGIDVIKYYLRHVLGEETLGAGFLTGGITFCAILPMRSIPFKVICLLGMNNNSFPRQSRSLGFDLMSKSPKPGDPSRRNDDRYLFLEAILSARERLYISYVGQSIEDNSLIPPSVVISELLDYVKQGFRIRGKDIFEHVITRHRLQAFNPEYFRGHRRLFSYSEEDCRAARSLLSPSACPPAFINSVVSQPGDEWKTVDLNDLMSLFRNPARFILQRRLGVTLEDDAEIPREEELFDLTGLEKYSLEQTLVEKALAGRKLEDYFSVARAAGRLPYGTIGSYLYMTLAQGAARFAARIRPYLMTDRLAPLDFNMAISGFTLTGRIDSIYTVGLIQFRYARLKAMDFLQAWMRQLVLNAIGNDDYPRRGFLFGSAESCEYTPVDEPQEILQRLLKAYAMGLSKPLKFFPASSWAYAEAVLIKGKSKEAGIEEARKVWEGSDFGERPGERDDPYLSLCFRNIDPLDAEFQGIAEDIFAALIAHQKRIEP